MTLITTHYNTDPPCSMAIIKVGTIYRCVRQLDNDEVDILTEGIASDVWNAYESCDLALRRRELRANL